ncbi:hypothetical protein V3H18_15805, partial [Methylocystis sp. 9N]
MARVISTIVTAAVAGAIGFGLGVYAAPNENVVKLREAIESGVESLKDSLKKDNAPTTEAPLVETPAEAPPEAPPAVAPEPAPIEPPAAVAPET